MYRINSFLRVNSAKCCTHTLAVVLAKRYVHDLPAFVAGGGHHHRNVQPGVAGEQRAGKRGLQQHIVLGANIGGQHFAAYLLGNAVHHAAALLLFPLVHLLREVVGRGAAAAGVGEHMYLEKADLFQKFAALFKIGLRLAGKAADAVGGKADRALPVGGAQLVHHLCILLGSVHAAHPAQGGSAAALQAQVELRAELPATLRQGLDTVLQQMKLPSITPVEENTQQKETGWQLDASTTWDDAAGSYTLRLETSSEASGADAVIRYTLASELDAGSARLQYWAVDKTPQGWSQTMQNCPKVAAALDNGVLTASGFDFTTGKKLVVQLAGLQPARGSSFGGQGIPVGEGGVLQTVHETDYMVRYPAVGMDLPLNAPYFPVDQTIQDGQAVNFGYMLRPPHGDSSALPDGTNNAWCNAAYTVTDANGQVMGCFRVGAGQPVGAGRWDAPLPQICPQSDTQYTVTLTLTAVQDAAGSGPSGTAQAACSSTAQVFVQP